MTPSAGYSACTWMASWCPRGRCRRWETSGSCSAGWRRRSASSLMERMASKPANSSSWVRRPPPLRHAREPWSCEDRRVACSWRSWWNRWDPAYLVVVTGPVRQRASWVENDKWFFDRRGRVDAGFAQKNRHGYSRKEAVRGLRVGERDESFDGAGTLVGGGRCLRGAKGTRRAEQGGRTPGSGPQGRADQQGHAEPAGRGPARLRCGVRQPRVRERGNVVLRRPRHDRAKIGRAH